MDYKETIKQFRVNIDKNIQQVKKYKENVPDIECSRRMQIVVDKLAEAKMWLGKCLEAYGSELPKEFQDKYKEDNKNV